VCQISFLNSEPIRLH